MTLVSKLSHRLVANSAIPYRSYSDITSNEANWVAGNNILASSRQLSERRPGFSDFAESGTATAFTSLGREFKWSKFGGTRYFSMLSEVAGGVAKVYKLEYGVDSTYQLLYAGVGSANHFDFAAFNDVLYFGNNSTATNMRAWDANSSTSRLWGIVRPSVVPTVSTSSTGISAYSGYFYRYTYTNSIAGNESSSSELSVCTGIFTNEAVAVGVTASTDTQVDGINIYRTTDGGSTDPSEMQLLASVTNATAPYNDTTPDGSLGTRTCPAINGNDPPPPCSKFAVTPGRIWGASGAIAYFSGAEELNGFSRQAECWPSGVTGNSYPFDKQINSLQPMTGGVTVFVSGTLWSVQGDLRSNFSRIKLLDRRGCVTHTNTFSLGNSVGWFDTSRQMWLSDLGEIGLDIRTDLQGVDPATAYVTPHISGRFHWVLLLDGATGKIFTYDLDSQKWMVPWQIQGATSASCLNSGETSAGTVKLTVAYNGSKVVHQDPTDYTDLGTAYAASGTLNLLEIHPEDNSDWNGVVDWINVETDAHIPLDVSAMLDDDPSTAAYTSLSTGTFSANPVTLQRTQGTNLVKSRYGVSTGLGQGERVSVKVDWAAVNSNFLLYTLDIAFHPKPDG